MPQEGRFGCPDYVRYFCIQCEICDGWRRPVLVERVRNAPGVIVRKEMGYSNAEKLVAEIREICKKTKEPVLPGFPSGGYCMRQSYNER